MSQGAELDKESSNSTFVVELVTTKVDSRINTVSRQAPHKTVEMKIATSLHPFICVIVIVTSLARHAPLACIHEPQFLH